MSETIVSIERVNEVSPHPKDAGIFSYEDIITLAGALLQDHSWFDTGDYSADQYKCDFCPGVSPRWASRESQIIHKGNCPVLIARDILTGVK